VYIESLQTQLVNLHLLHRDLWQSYLSQGRRLGLLREVVADLTLEIAVLRGRISTPTEMLLLQGRMGYAPILSESTVGAESNAYTNNIIGATWNIGTGIERMLVEGELQEAMIRPS
jgi:hypothetical protein